MVVGELLMISEQASLTSLMVQALNFLSTEGTTSLPDGRIEIAGSQVFALRSSYHTRRMTQSIEVEGHRQYLDLQYIVEGEELIGWVPESALLQKSPYDFEKDVWFGNLPANDLSWIRLSRGMGMLLYPSDGHAPQYAQYEPSLVHKIVVKIAI